MESITVNLIIEQSQFIDIWCYDSCKIRILGSILITVRIVRFSNETLMRNSVSSLERAFGHESIAAVLRIVHRVSVSLTEK